MMQIYFSNPSNTVFPFISYPVSCGEAAENNAPIEWLSLDDYVSRGRKDSVLYVRVFGNSMIDLGIESNDLVVIDRLKKAENGAKVLARLGSEYTIKQFSEIETYNKRKRFYLVPANEKYRSREVSKKDDFEIIGVVTFLIKSFV